MQPGRYDYAELIASLWKLGSREGVRMPTSHGLLDAALERIVKDPRFPSDFRRGLTFTMTSVGRRCAELPGILLAAQEALITSEPNPTYRATEVTIDQAIARQIAVGFGLRTGDAVELGRTLHQTVNDLREQRALHDEMQSAG